MKKQVSVSCPMDCLDLCRFIVTSENNRIIKLEGDKNHPITKGFICRKGKALVERLYHRQRIKHPLIKKEHGFVKASYEEIFDIISEKLTSIKEEYGTKAILNYSSDGYGGIKNRIQTIFFNCFGGVTQGQGSLCWGAGIAAQNYDFGSSKGNFPDDVLNSDIVIVWGRNPKYTSIHLYTLLKQAQKKGSRIIVIDPVKTATAKAFDEYVQVRPATDGALALAMANTIIEKNLHDKKFIEKYVIGFNRFKAYAGKFTLEKAEKLTGIKAETIETMALDYARSKTASIYIGFGMQRYHNSGNTIRCIDALGAITGKIGKKGCGINYAAKSIGPFINDVDKKSEAHAKNSRFFTMGKLGEFLQDVQDPPIKAVFVSCGNPLTQSPDLERTVKHFSRLEFKVVFDHFMTDTARHADIVIPAASVFEQDDLFATSMFSPVLNYSQKVVEPPKGVMSEFDFYLELARRMKLENLGFKDSEQYLKASAQPLMDKLKRNFTQLSQLSQLSGEYITIEEDAIAWEDKVFKTPSGKIELYSEKARQDGHFAFATFMEPLKGTEQFPLRLLTCHSISSMHSQGFAFKEDISAIYVNKNTADKFNLQNHANVRVIGKSAQLKVRLIIDEAICDNTAFMYQGWWHKSGAVNFLTNSVISDMGRQAAFYDSFCTIEAID